MPPPPTDPTPPDFTITHDTTCVTDEGWRAWFTVWADPFWSITNPEGVYQPVDAGSANRSVFVPLAQPSVSETVTVLFDDGTVLTKSVTVLRPAVCVGPPPVVPELPQTGGELWLAVFALGVICIGGGAVLFARRP